MPPIDQNPTAPPLPLAGPGTIRPEEWSELLDDAYDEYCELVEAGVAVDRAEFAARFPGRERSLLRLIDAHHALEDLDFGGGSTGSVAWPEPGDQFDRFLLVELIGKGTFARVYLATENGVGDRHVVLKVSRRPTAEADHLGGLQHESIVPVLSRPELPDGFHGVCMPFLGRTTLFDAIESAFAGGPPRRTTARDQRQPYVDWALETMIAVADAVAHAHDRDVVHGDVKSSNVLVTEDGPRLIDFNLASDDSNPLLRGGTLAYMRSEDLRALVDRGANADPAGDVHALAVTLYEALTNQLPYERPESGATVVTPHGAEEQLRIRDAGVRPVGDRNPYVDSALATWLEALIAAGHDSSQPLARTPEATSARAFAAKLRSFLHSGARLRRIARRHPVAAAVATITAFSMLLFLAGWYATLPSSLESALTRAAEVFDSDPAEALGRYEDALAVAPSNATALRGRFLALVALEEIERASEAFKAVPESARDRLVREAYAYCLAASRSGEAVAALTALVAERSDPVTLANLARCESRDHRFEESAAHYAAALVLAPDEPSIHYGLALLELRRSIQEKRAPDISLIESVLESTPQAPNVLFDAAVTLAQSVRASPDEEHDEDIDRLVELARSAVSNGLEPSDLGLLSALVPQLQGDARLANLPTRSGRSVPTVPRLLNPVHRG